MLDEGAGDLTSREFQERMEDISMRMSYEDAKDAFYGNFETLTANRDEAVKLLQLALNKPRFESGLRLSAFASSSLPASSMLPATLTRSRRTMVRAGLRRPSLRAAGQRHRRRPSATSRATISRATASAIFAKDTLKVVAVGRHRRNAARQAARRRVRRAAGQGRARRRSPRRLPSPAQARKSSR